MIEVLVAFVLLSMTLAVLLQIFSGGLQNAGTGERYAQAMVLADSKLEMLGGEQPITPGSVSGEEDGLSWQLDIVPFSDPSREASSRLVELFEVTLTVRWQLGSRERALTLNTLKLAASQ
ncbi:MAG: general secretion pathway protein GspI [Gammaproteobacteria bacterium]|nr:general secretion pathway protein GspI [Gammaproteobacteria bacterium]